MKFWDLQRYGPFNIRRAPKIVSFPGKADQYSIPTLFVEGDVPTWQEVTQLLQYPSFHSPKRPDWAFLPRHITAGYIRRGSIGLVPAEGGYKDLAGEFYQRESDYLESYTLECLREFRGQFGNPPLPYNRRTSWDLILVCGMKETKASEAHLRQRAAALYIIGRQLAWISWFRAWAGFHYRGTGINTWFVQRAFALRDDCLAKVWLTETFYAPEHYHWMTPPFMERCIGVVFHQDTLKEQASVILQLGIPAYDLVEPLAFHRRQFDPAPQEGIVWVTGGRFPGVYRDKWARVRLPTGEIVERFAFLPAPSLPAEVKNLIREAKEEIGRQAMAQTSERPWEVAASSALASMGPEVDSFDGGATTLHLEDGEMDAIMTPPSSPAPPPPPLSTSPPPPSTSPPPPPPPAAPAPAAPAVGPERRYLEIPECMWRALYLFCIDDEEALRIIELRRRFMATGWPETEGCRPRGPLGMTARQILRAMFHGTEAVTQASISAFRKAVDNIQGFPAMGEGVTWDDGTFNHLVGVALTHDDNEFLSTKLRSLPRQSISRLVDAASVD